MLVGIASPPEVVAADGPLDGMDEFVLRATKVHEVPGLAIAVVKDDAVVYARGFGVRELGKPDPVTADTLFAIGSCTKAFTAAVLGQLVDEGKITWDDRVTDSLPDFRLSDPYVTRELTIRDTLAHRCGLTRHDLLWYGSTLGRAELIKRLRQIPPDYSFRGKYSYNNLMYVVAGETAAAVAGAGWDKLITERWFRPLGMTRSNTSTGDLAGQADVATPHELVDDRFAPVPWRDIDNIGPAGSINASVNDMARWIRFQLGDGTVDGKRLLASATLKQMHTPQTVVPLEGYRAKLRPEAHLSSYALAWHVWDHRGKKVVEHGGSIDGMSAQVGLLPEANLGLVVLTNRGGSTLPNAVMGEVFDRFLGARGRDWSGDLLKLDLDDRESVKKREKADEGRRILGTQPSLAPDHYAGTYSDDLHGPLVVEVNDGRLSARFHGFTYDLEHWHHDTFRALDRDKRLARELWTFSLDDRGKVGAIKGTVFDGEAIDLKRQPKPVPVLHPSEAELARFVGKFASKAEPIEAEVELANGMLRVSIDGSPPSKLEAIEPTLFRVVMPGGDGDPRRTIRFDLAGDAAIRLTLDRDGVTSQLDKIQ